MKKYIAVILFFIFVQQAHADQWGGVVKYSCEPELGFFEIRVYDVDLNMFAAEPAKEKYLWEKQGWLLSTGGKEIIKRSCKINEGWIDVEIKIKLSPESCKGGSYPHGFLKLVFNRNNKGKKPFSIVLYEGVLIDDCQYGEFSKPLEAIQINSGRISFDFNSIYKQRNIQEGFSFYSIITDAEIRKNFPFDTDKYNSKE